MVKDPRLDLTAKIRTNKLKGLYQQHTSILHPAPFVYFPLALLVAFVLSGMTWVAFSQASIVQASGIEAPSVSHVMASKQVTPAVIDGDAGMSPNAIHLYVANLAGAHEVPAVDTPATGRAVLSVISDTVYYRIFVADIISITAAHIHEGAIGTNGGVVVPLFTGGGTFDPANPISGTLTLSPTQIAKLAAGEYYVNVHTPTAPSGEIRGQIQHYSPPAGYNALLLGTNEPSSVETDAKGVARFTLINTNTLQYQVAVSDIISVTASHIHFGPAGVNGPVAHGLYTGTGTFDPQTPISGTVLLNAKELVDLLTGYLYVNVHTSANPGGEIRDQIGGARLFGANLTGAAETPPNDNIGSGRALFALNANATELSYRVSVKDISGISGAHIHRGVAGVSGSVVFPLFTAASGAFDASHPVSGTIPLSVAQLMALIDNEYYVNVHTPEFPAGALRGQLQAMATPTHLTALLTGRTETPAVDTNAVGLARITLYPELGTLHYSVAVTDITDVTASHIHFAPKGQSGGVVFALYNSNSGRPFDAANPVAGAALPSAKDWVDLLSGYHYINVHTNAHPSGEIRGQIDATQLLEARLSAASEVPPVVSNARGHALMALNPTATALDYRVLVENITDITASHIHRGAAGVNGPVVAPLFTGSGTFDAANPISGTVPLNTAMILEMLAGNTYVNVHTSANPSGEIRGQVERYHPRTHYVSHLRGEAEVPPVTTNARGNAYFYLNSSRGVLHYTISVRDIVSATASHIHYAPVGVNGGVVFGLFSAASGASLDNAHPLGGGLTLTGKNIVDLLTGYYYINVHTANVPSGEIRGQIMDGYSLYLPYLVR